MDKYSKTRYGRAAMIHKRRTQFDLSHTILDTCNTGDFVPFLVEPVFSGETWSCGSTTLARLETSLHQTMDAAYAEVAFFFVPTQAVWDDYDAFYGANPDPWIRDTEVTIPQLGLHGSQGEEKSVGVSSLLHHLGIPAGDYDDIGQDNYNIDVSILPLRCVFKIWNDWYRDQNYDTEIAFATSSYGSHLGSGFAFNGSYFYPATGNLKVNRFHDLFSTVLPAPQKAAEVTLPLGTSAPVYGDVSLSSYAPLVLGNPPYSTAIQVQGDGVLGCDEHGSELEGDTLSYVSGVDGSIDDGAYADLSSATAVTINQLRLAIAAQAIAERDARGGTRMKEHYLSTWGVDVPDMELGRSEFLGGKRFPINMMEVLQTSETGTTVLGTDAGHSKTLDSSGGFLRSFKEDGFIIGFIYFRTNRSYSQGIDRKFFLKNRLDMPDPMLDNIGEVPVFGKELMALGGSAYHEYFESPIGYQEPWYWLKEETNKIRGFYQPGVEGSLSSWHYGDDYTDDHPVVDASWLKEGADNVDRTIAVSSNAAFQWSFNIYVDLKATRAFSKYNIPNTFGFGR